MITMIAIMFIYLLLCVSAAQWAEKKGRDFWTVFFISVAISPLAIIGSLWTPSGNKKSPLLK